MITPDWELKELFFRSKNDPKFGVKLGLKVTPKKRLTFTQHFYSIFGVIITPQKLRCTNKTNFMLAFIKGAL